MTKRIVLDYRPGKFSDFQHSIDEYELRILREGNQQSLYVLRV